MAIKNSSIVCGKAKRYVSSAAMLIIGALALYNWLLSPHIGYLHAVERLEPVAAQMAEEKNRICATRDGQLNELRRLRTELAEADGRVFTEDQAGVFLRRLLPLIEETGCTLVLADFSGDDASQPASDANEPVVVVMNPVSLTVFGRHDQIVVLFERLQTRQPKVWIDACRIAALDERSTRLECDLVLTMPVIRDERTHGDQ